MRGNIDTKLMKRGLKGGVLFRKFVKNASERARGFFGILEMMTRDRGSVSRR